MAYSYSGTSIERAERYLKQMVESDKDITWECSNPRKFSYRIREAIAAADRMNILSYSRLKEKYKLTMQGNSVVAKLRWLPKDPFENTNVVIDEDASAPTAIVTLAIQNNLADELRFPNAILNDSQLLLVYNWCTNSGSGFLIIDLKDNGIILTKRKSELAWKPPQTTSKLEKESTLQTTPGMIT